MKKARTYTTGEVAKFCGISQQSAIRAIDLGHLKGFRLPGSKHRIVPRQALLEFMLAVGIPHEVLAPFSDEERAAIDAAQSKIVGPLKLSTADRMSAAA